MAALHIGGVFVDSYTIHAGVQCLRIQLDTPQNLNMYYKDLTQNKPLNPSDGLATENQQPSNVLDQPFIWATWQGDNIQTC